MPTPRLASHPSPTPPLRAAAVHALPVRTPAAPQTVLIINRDVRQADAVVRMLCLVGYRAIAAYDARSAAEVLVRERPDVAVWDIEAPGADRRAAAGAVRLLLDQALARRASRR